MGFDIVSTWAPRVGPTGDDKYNLPDDTEIEFGAAAYSSPPTVPQLDAGTHINQILAACNKRASEYNTAFSTALRIFPYLQSVDGLLTQLCSFSAVVAGIMTVTTVAPHGYSPGHVVFINQASNIQTNVYMIDTVPTTTTFTIRARSTLAYTGVAGQNYCTPVNNLPATLILEIREAITALRLAEGLPVYTFIVATEIVGGLNLKATHIADLRKSLRISGVLTPVKATPLYFFGRSDASYPNWLPDYVYGGLNQVGKIGFDTTYRRRGRMLISHAIPPWYDGSGSGGSIRIVTSFFNEGLEPIGNIDLYSSNSVDFPYDQSIAPPGGPMANLNVFQDTIIFNSPDITLNVNLANILSFAGLWMSFIVGTRKELTGIGAWNPVQNNSSSTTIGATNGALTIDLGA